MNCCCWYNIMLSSISFSFDFPTWLGIIWFSCLLICTKLDVSPFLSELLEFALCLRDYPLQKGYVTLCIDDPPGVEYDAVLFFIYVSYHILFVLVHFVCFIIYYMISYHIIYHIISYHIIQCTRRYHLIYISE